MPWGTGLVDSESLVLTSRHGTADGSRNLEIALPLAAAGASEWGALTEMVWSSPAAASDCIGERPILYEGQWERVRLSREARTRGRYRLGS